MAQPKSESPRCPKCGSTDAELCGQSLEYGPEQWLGQPIKDRELHTLAYQCKCGMAFTETTRGDRPRPRS